MLDPLGMEQRQVITASAPGKVILCGEYSVLEGWPALVIAADRRLNLRLEPRNEPGILVEARGLNSIEELLQWQDERGFVCKPDSALSMLVEILNALLFGFDTSRLKSEIAKSLGLRSDVGWRLISDSSELFDGKNKLGLGSSAALTSAIAGAVFTLKNQALPENTALWSVLQNIHSVAQGKRGSGVDLAASIAGGVNTFVNKQDVSAKINSMTLPENLHFAFFWSGQSAATPKFLNSLSQWQQRNRNTYENAMAELGRFSEKVCASELGNRFVENLSFFTESLYAFDIQTKLGVFSGGHEALYLESKKHSGLVYKPCGAGGGDLGLAVSDQMSIVEGFKNKAGSHGFRVVPLSTDERGMLTSRVEHA